MALTDADVLGLLVKPNIAKQQLEAESIKPPVSTPSAGATIDGEGATWKGAEWQSH